MNAERPVVAIIMGSRSDWPTMKAAAESLESLGVPFEAKVVSAHRTPERLYAFAKGAKAAGFKDIFYAKKSDTAGLTKTVMQAVEFAKSADRLGRKG